MAALWLSVALETKKGRPYGLPGDEKYPLIKLKAVRLIVSVFLRQLPEPLVQVNRDVR